MSDWTAGYVSEIGYTYGYFPELNPARMALSFLNAGLVPPTCGTACELGFGQGITANIHAASSGTSWYGTDFNPAHAAFAQELADQFQGSIRLSDEAFDAFCTRPDLPDFDFIALHGIWSWVSHENRAVIVEFIRRKLKFGGVVYISYNTLPGWSAFGPIQHLMAQHAERLGRPGEGLLSRVKDALDFSEEMIALNARTFQAVVDANARFAKIKAQDPSYLAHEYFNGHWQPMYFADMAKWLQEAKLDYACPANSLETVDAIHLSEAQQDLLSRIPDEPFRQTIRDYFVNRQFRTDYWVKGKRTLPALARTEQLREQAVILVSPRASISLKAQGSLGEATLNKRLYGPLLDCLSNHQPHRIGALEEALSARGATFPSLLQALMILMGQGHVAPAVPDPSRAPSAHALNQSLQEHSRMQPGIRHLASPVTGGGIPVGRFSQLFLLARNTGAHAPRDCAQYVWSILKAQGQNLVKDGTSLETEKANLDELEKRAQAFWETELPVLLALGAAPLEQGNRSWL